MIKFTKNTIRIIYYIISFLLLFIFYYIGYGHKQYSILEKYQHIITYNIKKEYGIELQYQKLDEDWDYFKPNIDMKNVLIKDSQGNEIKSDHIVVRLDLLYSIINKKIKIKKIFFDNTVLKYNHLDSVSGDISSFDFKNININEIKISNLNLDISNKEKNYLLEGINLKYKNSNDYFTMNYNDIEIKQFIDDIEGYKTEINGNSNNIINSMQKILTPKELELIGYNNIFRVDGNLKFVLNFKNKENYSLDVLLNDNIVYLIPENMVFNSFSGKISYLSSDNKLYSDKMTCITNNKPCSLQIVNQNNDISLNFEAFANNKTLLQYVPFIENNNFSGSTKITGSYSLLKNNYLTIKSDLEGLEIKNMPFVSKNKNDKLNLNVEAFSNKNISNLKVSIEGIQVLIDLNNKLKTEVHINQENININNSLSNKNNLYIKGEIDNLDVKETISFIKNLKFDETQKNSYFLYYAELYLNNPNYLGINPERVIYIDDNGKANIEIVDNYFQGKIFYDLKNNYMNINMDKFYYQSLGDNNDINENIKISEFPKIEGLIKDLNINGYKGNLSFNGNYINNFYIVDNIIGSINKIIPNFIIKISQEENITTELLSINENKIIEFENIADILDSYGYSNTLTSEKGIVYGSIYWNGLKPNIKTLNGNVKFDIQKGKINTVSTGNRVLKIFKIFEVNMLSEIFKLDFDFIKKGTKYDSLIGSGSFTDGVYIIDKNIEMKSSNYNAKMSGKIDFVKEEFENKIKIDLPISQKLPTIALLTGNPAAIAGVWLTDKLIGDKINSLSSLSFNIKGTFEKPNITK